MLESEDKLKHYAESIGEWRKAFGGVVSQQVVEDLILVGPFSNPELAKKEDDIVDGLNDKDRTAWFRREIEFYRRELAGIKFMYDQERQQRMQASQGGQPPVQKGYPRSIPPNMSPEQVAAMVVSPAGKSADDLEKEGAPEGMPDEVFKLVLKRMREHPDGLPPHPGNQPGYATRPRGPRPTNEQMAKMIKPPPGKTSEDLLKDGPPNGMPLEVFDMVIKRL